MDFIETIKQRAKQDKKTIVLPEAEDIRTLKATEIALKEKYANIILIGNEKNIKEKAKENIILMLNEKGIVITELEMDMMIEAVVNGFNQGLQKDGDFIESL